MRLQWVVGRVLGVTLAGVIALAHGSATAEAPVSSGASTLLERLRARAAASPGSAPGSVESADQSQARSALLHQGEAALAGLDVAAALQYFERAALMRHAADSEMGLIRTYMQGGQYRRALAFSAHTAGAHADAGGAAALYAWLLLMGGQRAQALQIADTAAAKGADDAALRFVNDALHADGGRIAVVPLVPPARLAPYGMPGDLPPRARWRSTGTVVDAGRAVVIPAAGIRPGSEVWIRDGLGRIARGRVDRSTPAKVFRVVRLDQPLAQDVVVVVAPRDPFPGSVIHAVEYVAARDAGPSWPWLVSGFAGSPDASSGVRSLGVELPAGSRGGPVFDAQGRLAGIAVADGGRANRLLLPSELQPWLPPAAPSVPGPDNTVSRAGIDEIYERSLRIAVQVYTPR